MSEKLSIQPEVNDFQAEALPASHEQLRSKSETSAESSADKGQQERLTAIRSEVNKEAHETRELRQADAGSERTHATHHPVKKQLQAMMRDRTLKRIRKQLPVPERALSKVIHAKPIEILSAGSEKTIARPYGLFGGGLTALLGTVLAFYMARNYGFEYNIFLFFSLFVAGYILATLVEIGVGLANRKR